MVEKNRVELEELYKSSDTQKNSFINQIKDENRKLHSMVFLQY